MTLGWSASPGAHAVQFYEAPQFLYRSIATFLADALRNGHPAVMIAKLPVFDAVVELMDATDDPAIADAGNRIRFIEVDEALQSFMAGPMPDPVRLEQTVAGLISDVRGGGASAEDPICIYGEMAGTLCKQGNYAGGLLLEQLWNAHFSGPEFIVLCGYAIGDFDDAHADDFRATCRQHSHVIPAEDFTDAPDERARLEQVALLQQRARAFDPLGTLGPDHFMDEAGEPVVYVLDDDASIRRSLARLLSVVGWRVRTFASAESFLAEADPAARGCFILDVQLAGMSGPELQSRLAAGPWFMPVIAMSGSHDGKIEAEALRLGATAFLRKPFDAQVLIEAVGRAISGRKESVDQ